MPKTFGGTILHVLTHATILRWEMQHMLQRLGLGDLIEGDVHGWEQRVRYHIYESDSVMLQCARGRAAHKATKYEFSG
jgi:hypothetical protein